MFDEGVRDAAMARVFADEVESLIENIAPCASEFVGEGG